MAELKEFSLLSFYLRSLLYFCSVRFLPVVVRAAGDELFRVFFSFPSPVSFSIAHFFPHHHLSGLFFLFVPYFFLIVKGRHVTSSIHAPFFRRILYPNSFYSSFVTVHFFSPTVSLSLRHSYSVLLLRVHTSSFLFLKGFLSLYYYIYIYLFNGRRRIS